MFTLIRTRVGAVAAVTLVVVMALAAGSISAITSADALTASPDAPFNLRFRKTATETVLLWDDAPGGDRWVVLVDGLEAETVYEKRFEVTDLLAPHAVVRLDSGQRSDPSSRLTYYEPAPVDPGTPPEGADPGPTTTVPDPTNPAPVDTSPSEPGPAEPGPAEPGPSDPTEPDSGSTPTSAPSPADPVAPISGDLIIGMDTTPPLAGWSKPAVGGSYQDGVYGTSIRRVSSADGTRFNRNTYSRRQAENADGSLFFTYHGDSEYRVYDRTTLELVNALDVHPDGDPQWHPTDPRLLRHTSGDDSYTGSLQLLQTNVVTGNTAVLADLTAAVSRIFPAARYLTDGAEGSPSADGNHYAWMVQNGAEQPIGIISYDLAQDSIIGSMALPDGHNGERGRLDWVSASPTGDHVMASWGNGTYAFDADLGGERLIYERTDHSDIALSATGDDVYVYIDFSAGANGGWLIGHNLHTGDSERLFEIYQTRSNTSVHVSGKGYNKPGWVLISTYNCKVDGGWACGKVMAVELTGQHRIVNLAHTRNCGDNYWTETHAVVNRDFTRVMFNSDGGSCGIDAEVYELTVPPFE